VSTIRQHLANFHASAAAHHNELAKCYHQLSSFEKGSKSRMSDEEIASDGITQCLGKIAATHQAAAEYHTDAMAECTKSTDDELDKIVPLGVSMVAPPRDGVRAIIRNGQREIGSPEVPAQFAKLVSVEE
jgi:hypothetical protein